MEEAIEWLPPPSQPTHWLRLRVDLGLERHSGLDSPRWSRSRCQPALPLLSFVAGSHGRVCARNYALDTPPHLPLSLSLSLSLAFSLSLSVSILLSLSLSSPGQR